MQLGLRYLRTILPAAFLLASAVVADTARGGRLRMVIGLGLAICLPLSLRFHPHHLPYFNELAGGPAQGHEHLLDSNVDWGQGLLEVKTYMAANNVDTIGLAYFGAVNPSDLGITF